MNFNLNESIEILSNTPKTLNALTSELSDGWLQSHEGEGTWNIIEVLEHLIEADQMNWIPRLEHILSEGDEKPFPPFDRFAHLHKSYRPLNVMLSEFEKVRQENISRLKELVRDSSQYDLKGYHPDFGEVKVRELVSTWVVHDFTHISQIVRIMAERYREDVGPWVEYLGVLKKDN